jgi:hypothetical protein
MTSGSTPAEGLTAPMLFYDPAHPPQQSEIAGKILVFATAKQPAPPYNNNFLDNYTPTDSEWRSAGKWPEMFVPPPTSYGTSFRGRWEWSQVNRFADIGIKGHAAGIVIVYDLSPAMALGLVQRSVYTETGRAGLGTAYVNCPTLTLDRVNGAKVITDAKAGKMATLTLRARFQRDTGKAIIAYLPGKNYGTPMDEQVLLATHTDAMSLIEENGGLGMIGIMSYFNHIPKAQRPRTIIFYFDCRHFMPGAEASWPQYDYYNIHPEKLKTIVATVGMEHMGGRQTIEVGDTYGYSKEKPEDGGVITSLIDVHNNNPARGDRQQMAARRREGRPGRGPRHERRLPGIGQESDEQGARVEDPGLRPRGRLAGQLDADVRAGRHGSRSARLRRELLHRAGRGALADHSRVHASPSRRDRSRLGRTQNVDRHAEGWRLRIGRRCRRAPQGATGSIRGRIPAGRSRQA